MSLEKAEIKVYMRHLYKFLKDGHTIEFKKMSLRRGYIDDGRVDNPECYKVYVALDHRDRVLSTLIHEHLHYLYPDWSETKIYAQESAIINSLSNTQIKNIIKRLANAL